MFLLVTFLAGILTVAGIYSIISDLYLRDRSRISRRVDDEFRKRQRERAKKATLFKQRGPLTLDVPAEDETPPSRRQRLEALIEQSGLNLTLQSLLTLMGLVGVSLAVAGGLLWQSFLAAAGGAVVGAAGPLLYVVVKRRRRLEKLIGQLPDAFDLMARVIRAGQTMSQAMQGVAEEFDQPISGEFAYCYEQQNLGLPPELALRDLARRTGLVEIKIFVLALVVQQQTGGNLAELLDKLSAVIRERFRIRGRIRALTAEGRLQAAILLVLPPAMLLFILIFNPRYEKILFEHPSLVIGMFVSELLGFLWIRKIVNFDY
jgi:tight adherence protein B